MKSSATTPSGPNDEPEEGEIVSDNDLEDISDDSMILTPCNGKSLSHREHLRALSLSSVSDVDVMDEPPDEPITKKRRKRRKSHADKQVRRRKRRRRNEPDSDSSDNDATLDRTLKYQLKKAIHVDLDDNHKNNSLRTRLRAMVKGTSGADSDLADTESQENYDTLKNVSDGNDMDTLKDGSESKDLHPLVTVIDLVEQDKTSSCVEIVDSISEYVASASEDKESAADSSCERNIDEIDNELMQLRIEALKTAITNKFANKKKQKNNDSNFKSCDDTNKENTNNNSGDKQNEPVLGEIIIENQKSSEIGVGSDSVPPSPEDDEDVLRALLLASMSKKITKLQPESPKFNLNKIETKSSLDNQQSKMANNKMKRNKFTINNFKTANGANRVINKLSGATKLVKVSQVQIKPQVKPLIINLDSDSGSDMDLSSSPEKSPQKEIKNKLIEPNKAVKNLTAVIGNFNANSTNVKTNINNLIENTVENFLREQRAKVETEVSASDYVNKHIITNNDLPGSTASENNAIISEHKTLNVSKSDNSKKAQVAEKNNGNIDNRLLCVAPEKSKIIKKAAELEKSALKFLPASKREEYQKLQDLLRLKKAQLKKPRIRRASQKIHENCHNFKITVLNKNDTYGTQSEAGPLVNKLQKTEALPVDRIIKNPSALITDIPNKKHLKIPMINPTKNEKMLQSKKILNSNLKDTIKPKNQAGSQVKINEKNLNRTGVSKPAQTLQINTKTSQVQLSAKVEARLEEFKRMEIRSAERRLEKAKVGALLQATLLQLQTKTDGRLQIQEKYRHLRPMVKKLNDLKKEQKHWDQEVERLFAELIKAKEKQEIIHKKVTTSVKELYEAKKDVDLSTPKSIIIPKPCSLFTSTPIKDNLSITAINSPSASNISEGDTLSDHLNTSKDNTLVENTKGMLNTWEQSTVCNNPIEVKEEKTEIDTNVVDPNDIDNIIKKTEERVAVLEKRESLDCRKSDKVRYVSPLDACTRKDGIDPFGIMCPFEVNGTCKDPECAFNHLPK